MISVPITNKDASKFAQATYLKVDKEQMAPAHTTKSLKNILPLYEDVESLQK
jgi:hypothetical protein